MKKNILIIIHHLCRGGSEKSAAKLSSFLSDNHNVYVATFLDELYYPTTYASKGSYLCLNQGPTKGLIRKIINFWERLQFIRSIKKKYEIDVSISFLQSADIVNIITKKNEKIIVSIRTSITFLLKRKLNELLYAVIFKQSDKIVLQNNENKNALLSRNELMGSKIKVIPNFYNIKEILSKSEKNDIQVRSKDEKVLLNVGRLYAVKGQLFLFRILKQLLLQGCNVKLILVGEGELRAEYLQFCQDIKLTTVIANSTEKTLDLSKGDVFFQGFSANPYEYIKFCDLFTFTSSFEGFPNALAEAMICEACVVSTDCNGSQELISSHKKKDDLHYPIKTERGILLPVFDNQDIDYNSPISEVERIWVRTISEMLNDDNLRKELGQNASKWMLRFDESLIKNKWEELVNA